MGSKKHSRETLLHSCAHHLESKNVVANVLLLEDCVEIRCYEPRTREIWSQKISLCHVSAMVQSYHFDLSILWELLARCMQLFGDDLSFSTQHIVYYNVVSSSAGQKALHIYEVRITFLVLFFCSTADEVWTCLDHKDDGRRDLVRWLLLGIWVSFRSGDFCAKICCQSRPVSFLLCFGLNDLLIMVPLGTCIGSNRSNWSTSSPLTWKCTSTK